jgi:hypothetical protein
MCDDGEALYAWERYPEYLALNQYSRCLGRLLVTLPRRVERRVARTLIRGAILIGEGIVGAHASVPAEASLSREERKAFRDAGLESIAASRDGLRLLKEERLGSQPDLLAALELLERVESGLRTRPLPEGA